MRRAEIRVANLRLLVAEFGTVTALAAAVGTNDNYLRNILNGVTSASGTPRGVGDRMAARLERASGKPDGWMDTPHTTPSSVASRAQVGTPSAGSVGSDDLVIVDDDMDYSQAHSVSLAPGEMWLPRHHGVYPRMGGGGVQETEVVTMIRVAVEGLRRQLAGTEVTRLEALRLITARGQSMMETFGHGDLLLVDTGVHEVAHDGIYVLRSSDDIQVKRVQKRRGGQDWLLLSDNPRYQPEVIAGVERAGYQIMGRVVYAWSGSAL